MNVSRVRIYDLWGNTPQVMINVMGQEALWTNIGVVFGIGCVQKALSSIKTPLTPLSVPSGDINLCCDICL